MIYYYSALPLIYHQQLEENNATILESALQICLEHAEKLRRIGVLLEIQTNETNMTSILQLMKDMRNRLISYECRLNSQPQNLAPRHIHITQQVC